jgi:hypothetical protein
MRILFCAALLMLAGCGGSDDSAPSASEARQLDADAAAIDINAGAANASAPAP